MERKEPESVDEPIIARLDKLKGQYRAFIADGEARVLLWKIAEDEARMLEAFVHQNAITAETGDSILEVPCQFDERSDYGIVIVHDLDEVLDQIADALGDSGPPQPIWMPPYPPASLERRPGAPAPDQHYLAQAMHSLWEHMQPHAKHLTLLLEPRSVSDPGQYIRWLSDLVPLLDDEKVRYIVPHDGSQPQLVSLGALYKGRVMSAEANLDMPSAYEEIAAKTKDADQPPGQFRLQFIKIGKAIGKKDLAGARAAAAPAIAIAKQQGWPHLEFAAQQALATGELGLGDSNAAMATFAQAGDSASRAVASGAEWAEPLVLQSRLGMGAVAVTLGAWPLGAKLYGEQALPSAVKSQDKLAQLDCLRMAAYCEERAGAFDAAWQHLVQALNIGREFGPEQREASTLAFVGQAMLRICRTERYSSYQQGVDQQLVSLLGQDWQSKAAPQTPKAGSDAASPLETAAPPPGLPIAPSAPAPEAEPEPEPEDLES